VYRLVSATTLTGLLSVAAFGQPTSLTYQGQLKQQGLPLNDLVDMRFTLYDSEPAGKPIAGPLSFAAVAVENGLFTVELDFGAAAFQQGGQWLRIDVRAPHDPSDVSAYTTLTPRQRITATPFALSVPGLATSEEGVEVSGNIHTPGEVIASAFSSNSPLIFKVNPSNTECARFKDTNCFLGLGTTNPLARLHIGGTPGVDGIRFPDGSLQTTAAGVGAGGFWSASGTDIFNNNGGNVGIGTSIPANKLTVRTATLGYGVEHTDGDIRLSTFVGRGTGWLGTLSNHKLSFFANDNGSPHLITTLDTAGRFGVGTDNPIMKLHVEGDEFISGSAFFGERTRQMLNLYGTGFGVGVQAAAVYFRSGGGFAWHWGGAHNDATYNSGGGTTLMTLDNTRGLDFGSRLGQHLSLWGSDGPRRYGIGIQAQTLYNRVGNNAGDGFAWFKGGVHNDNKQNPGGGIALLTLDEETGLTARGNVSSGGTMSCKVLTVTGADVAEKFPSREDKVEPGTVMEIDPQHPGELRVAREAYSSRVAGVVSGAGDIPAGAILGNFPGSENAPAIALSGRVWVRCNAGTAAIAPGDLLTSSDVEGYAMKAADRERSHGAIIGKAMSALSSGERGLVLVLVNLQ